MRLFGRRRSERSREKRITRWSFKRKKKPSRKTDKKTLSELSKIMAYILRHDKKQEFLVDLDENCYAKVDQLVKAISSIGKWRWVNRKHVEEVAAKSVYRKQRRFVIKGGKIKATYRITRKCPSTPPPPPPPGYYVIIAKHSGKCLDVGGISTDDRASIIQWDYWKGDNQKWKLEPVEDGYFRIIAKHSGKCLDVSGISKHNGAKIIQYQYWGGDNQKWKLKPVGNGYYCIIAKHSGKCLDVNSKSKDDRAMIQQFRCMGGDNQKWKLKPVKTPEEPTDGYWFEKGLKAKEPLTKIEYFTEALRLNPKHVRALRNKGYTLINDLKRYEEAIECFDKALEIDPTVARAWRNKGYALENLKRYEDAIACFDKALEIDSKNAHAWSHKGYTLNGLERYKEAITCLDKALKINSKNAHVWYNKGFVLFNFKKYEEAIWCVDKALELNSTYEDALKLKSRIEEEKLKGPASELVTIERTFYDPYNNKFIVSRPQDLPQVREWIEQRDLSAYWFIVSIRNDTNEDIKGWGVELEMKPSLMVVQALIRGIEGDQKHEITTERPWDSKKYSAGVSSDAGIVISPRTTRQIYFKLRSNRPKTDYTINGIFKCANFEPIQIKPKSFTFWCDAVILRDAIKTNPEIARNCVETELGRRYPDKIIERLANSFRIILDLRSNYCNTDTKAREINKEFDLLKMYFTEKEFLAEIENVQRRLNAELREDERLDEKHVEAVKNFCEKFTEMWIAKFLR